MISTIFLRQTLITISLMNLFHQGWVQFHHSENLHLTIQQLLLSIRHLISFFKLTYIHLKEKCVVVLPYLIIKTVTNYTCININKITIYCKNRKNVLWGILYWKLEQVVLTLIFCHSVFETLIFYNVMLIQNTS